MSALAILVYRQTAFSIGGVSEYLDINGPTHSFQTRFVWGAYDVKVIAPESPLMCSCFSDHSASSV